MSAVEVTGWRCGSIHLARQTDGSFLLYVDGTETELSSEDVTAVAQVAVEAGAEMDRQANGS
jgi:hypothetical protein